MKRKDYEKLMDKEIFAEIKKTAKIAGVEYANYEDGVYDEVFDNFIRHGQALGLDRKMIWAIYFNKHSDAVLRYIKENGANEQREDIRGRIIDMILYLSLLYGMISEDKDVKKSPVVKSSNGKMIRVDKNDESVDSLDGLMD